MMNKYTLAASIVAVCTVTLVVCSLRKNKFEKRLADIADAGYETAHDVLYPLKSGKFTRIFR